MIQHSVKVFSTCPIPNGTDQRSYLQNVIDVAQWSERVGCRGILVYSDNSQVDPWLISQVILENTDHLCPLPAIQPVYMHPYAVAKAVTTLAYLYGRRLYLNMIVGGYTNDLLALNDLTPHDKRYARLIEYTMIIKELLASESPASYDGEFYKVDKLRLKPPLDPNLLPGIFVSGSSEAGLAAARIIGAIAIKYPKPPGEETTVPNDGIDYGVRIGIITRETDDEAWRVAHERYPEDRKGQLTHQLAMKVSDSVWHKQLGSLDNGSDSNPYWLVPFKNYKAFCPYLVGSYERVAEEVARYTEAGYKTFILDIPPTQEELSHIAFVFPALVETGRGMIQRVQDWVGAQAQQRPETTALVLGNEQMTYGRLEEISNQLARMLRKGGCGRGDRVCLLLPKSPTAIVSILGVLKAGCIYVPLDPSCPAARLAKMVATSENRWMLVAGPAGSIVDELADKYSVGSGMRIGWLDERATGMNRKPEFSLADLSAFSSEPLDSLNTARDPAYLMFTSGSTGNPKGVVITHSNVIHFVEWAISHFGIGGTDRLSCHSPLHFDLSVFDIFGACAAGAELHLVAPELNVLPNKLADFIRDSELTQWFSVPSVLNYMAKFDVVTANDFPALKRLLWCGEVLPVPALSYFMRRLPHVSFTNLYGPTEATIASSYYDVPGCPEDEREAIPIGTPCGGEDLLVLDEQLKPVEPGETGHLYIQGVGLSLGYYKDAQKTSEVFLRNPYSSDPSDRLYNTGDLAKVGEDGLVYFVGRADSQIKSRGHRIELGEVATALNALGSLRESAVVAIPSGGFEGMTICCAYVTLPHCDVNPATLRTELSKVLPRYMLPTRWMAMHELPKNASGKIDASRVREQFPVEELA